MNPVQVLKCRPGRAKGHHHRSSEHAGPIAGIVPLAGLICLIWLLLRAVPKPSRLQYPCMKAAAPLAGLFLAEAAGMIAAAFSFTKVRQYARSSRRVLASLFALTGLTAASFLLLNPGIESTAASAGRGVPAGPEDSANCPMGTARGICPGRVVWIHNPDATNENCTPADPEHGWFMSENMNQAAVDEMLSAGLESLTGQTSDTAAWGAVFRYHNSTRGKGAVGYSKGEKVFIKINATSAMHVNPADLTSTSYQGVSETSVASVRAVLRQLVNIVGVAQNDISVGDPMKHIYKHLYDVWHAEFPDVHYLDHDDYANLGREQAVASTTARITYSDKGMFLRTSEGDTVRHDELYSILEDAEYILNVPMLKGHMRAGVTMFAKNHFGSQTRPFASHLHNGLVSPEGYGDPPRAGYGLYRVQVDFMTHDILGGKNLVYILDALWPADIELGTPIKWKMQPFNGDYMSSLFLSLDPVAIESVGYDFLRTECTAANGHDPSAQLAGVDDYLHQAADSTRWPSGIAYDPNNSGVHVASLGVHEHWNNATAKKYTRNLGTGGGIELIGIEQTTPDNVGTPEDPPEVVRLYQSYPNPFNPLTTIAFRLPSGAPVSLKVFDVLGREVSTLVAGELSAGTHARQWDGTNFSGGVYFYRLRVGSFLETRKFVLLK